MHSLQTLQGIEPRKINRNSGALDMQYITWNQFNAASIKQAEQRKQKLEREGWTLVHSTVSCLTYQKEH